MKLRDNILTRGFAVERRELNDASISVGKVRIRMPQWSFWILLALVVGFFAMQICSIKWTGRPIPIKGVIEPTHRSGSLTNRLGVVEVTVRDHEKRIGILEARP